MRDSSKVACLDKTSFRASAAHRSYSGKELRSMTDAVLFVAKWFNSIEKS
jgi:hypothetical protein